MSAPRRLAAVLIGTTLLLSGAACQSSSPQTEGSTVKPYNADMPALPESPKAAEAAVRAMLMKEAVPLLEASGLKYAHAQFGVPTSYDDEHSQNGDLLIQFRPCSDQETKAMTDAIWAHGWAQGGVSHGVNVHKGPLFLKFGKSIDGCDLHLTTVNISQYLPGIEDITRVPELAAYEAVR
jgi:hypothetical protein